MLPFRAKRYADQRRFFHADFSTRLIPVIVPANWCLRESVCSTSINKAVWFRCAVCLLVVKRTDYSLAINWDAFVVMQRWLKRAWLLWFYRETNLRYYFFFFFVLKICINQIFKSYELRFHRGNEFHELFSSLKRISWMFKCARFSCVVFFQFRYEL